MLSGRDEAGRIAYALHLGGRHLPLEDRIGRPFALRFTGARTCLCCGRRVRKFYGQGLCYPCLRDAPEASACIVRPELCRAHLGEGRDPQWERDHHLQEHFVYLAQTGAAALDPAVRGGIKVGVTRSTQVPTRWIDQGAVLAVLIARVPYRQLAGAIEVDLKRIFTDRTDWRAMLRQVSADPSALVAARALAIATVEPALRPYMLHEEEPLLLDYPLRSTLPRVASISLEATPEVRGTLIGVKGQYLLFGDGRVLNIRNHSGFHVDEEIFSDPM
ncbi:MAG TPA: DUF2797 domain-containing protein [Flavobacteriales bacterium]